MPVASVYLVLQLYIHNSSLNNYISKSVSSPIAIVAGSINSYRILNNNTGTNVLVIAQHERKMPNISLHGAK